MEIIEPRGDIDFEQYYELRWRILCAPWRKPRGIERDELDATATHLMARDARRRVVGVGRLHLNTPEEAQIRFMAVDTASQRQGVGGRLLQDLENAARREGARYIVLNARESAVSFYEQAGYEMIGPAHTLWGVIPHFKMVKALGNPPKP